jgi:adenosylcobalamin-dependent ribonucleoside-triphosphate reductase
MRQFKLSETFLDSYKDKQPKFGPLGYTTYVRTYSRNKQDGTQEEFWETAKRVVEGCYSIQKEHCKNLGVEWNNEKAQYSAQEMYRRIWDFKFLPPGRGLWMMGTDTIERHAAGLFNCGFVSSKDINVDLAEPFCWSMEMLMMGCGTGFDVQGAGAVKIVKPRQSSDPFIVPDTREGWVAALRAVITPFSGKGALPNNFDVSNVRKAGEPIKGFGGVSSGPEPLLDLLDRVKEILNNLIGMDITVTAINDIMNLIGRCVVSGNVRRSAELSLGNYDDEEFLNLKNPDLFSDKLMEYRWASNNSVFTKVGIDYSRIASMAAKNGEPGCVWLDNCRKYGRMKDPIDNKDYRVCGVNPCAEICLDSMELCNIVETFPSNHDSLEDYLKTLKYAYLYAKTVTLLKTHSERTNAVIQRNRRIGCSMSGITQAVTKFGRRQFFEMCDKGYSHLKDLDREYSDWLCIPRSIKISTVKPSGSVSLLSGNTPGIHFPHSEYYIRRIRFQSSSPMLKTFEKNGYKIEKDVYSPNTVCVEFPVKEGYYTRGKADVSIWEQVDMAANMQYYWADNSVSITVTVKPEENKDIVNVLELNETRLKTVSFLPLQDHKYQQAPYETITKEQYEDMTSHITPITSFSESKHEVTEIFCSNDVCEIRTV